MANKCNSAQHYCGIGGQAVLEGVMMKNGDNYAVAVRKEDGSIVLRNETYKGFLADTPVRKIPIVRGFFVRTIPRPCTIRTKRRIPSPRRKSS